MDILKHLARGVLIFALLQPSWLHAAEALKMSEPQIKAGLLYNFIKYTQWPEENTAIPITVCTYGDDPFNGALKPMQERTVNQRGIALRNVYDIASITGCHLLFISEKEQTSWPAIQNSISGKPILTVSDFKGFASRGGMIEFSQEGNRIGASLDLGATKAAGLIVEERLLKLVTIVGGGQ